MVIQKRKPVVTQTTVEIFFKTYKPEAAIAWATLRGSSFHRF